MPPLVDRSSGRAFSTDRKRAATRCWVSDDTVRDHESLVRLTSTSAPARTKRRFRAGKASSKQIGVDRRTLRPSDRLTVNTVGWSPATHPAPMPTAER